MEFLSEYVESLWAKTLLNSAALKKENQLYSLSLITDKLFIEPHSSALRGRISIEKQREILLDIAALKKSTKRSETGC